MTTITTTHKRTGARLQQGMDVIVALAEIEGITLPDVGEMCEFEGPKTVRWTCTPRSLYDYRRMMQILCMFHPDMSRVAISGIPAN